MELYRLKADRPAWRLAVDWVKEELRPGVAAMVASRGVRIATTALFNTGESW